MAFPEHNIAMSVKFFCHFITFEEYCLQFDLGCGKFPFDVGGRRKSAINVYCAPLRDMSFSFRVPPCTKYSPSNAEDLQQAFQKRLRALIRLMRQGIDGDLSLSNSRSPSQDHKLLELYMTSSCLRSTAAHSRAFHSLLSELEILRRRIVSHPIHFIPLELLVRVFEYVVSLDEVLLLRVCRSWETILLTAKTPWSFIYTSITSKVTYDLALFLSKPAPLDLHLHLSKEDVFTNRSIPLDCASSIRSLSIGRLYDHSGPAILDFDLIPSFNIATLTVYSFRTIANLGALEAFGRLTSLTIGYHGLDAEIQLKDSEFTLPVLTDLDLEFDALPKIFDHLIAPRLETLTLVATPYYQSHRSLLGLACSFRTLKSFRLRSTDDEIHWTARSGEGPDVYSEFIRLNEEKFAMSEYEVTCSNSPHPIHLGEHSNPSPAHEPFMGCIPIAFTHLTIELLVDDVFPEDLNLSLSTLRSLELSSTSASAISMFVASLQSVSLRRLFISFLDEFHPSSSPVPLQALEYLEYLTIDSDYGPAFVLKGEWGSLCELEIAIACLNFGELEGKCQFPQVVKLYLRAGRKLAGETFAADSRLLESIFNMDQVRHLKLDINRELHIWDLKRFSALETVEFTSESPPLVDNLLCCPHLHTISTVHVRDWDKLYRAIALREQARVLGALVSPITLSFTEIWPSESKESHLPQPQHAKALALAMNGEYTPIDH